MKRLLFSLLVVTTIFTGCAQSTKRYDVAMKNGLEQIEKENYEEALSEFDKAIAEKSEDSLAKANRMQTFDLIEAKKMIADQKINEANEALDKVINERLGSPKIAGHAREEKEKLTGKKAAEEKVKDNETKEAIWTEAKAEELSAFMTSWGSTMDQSYKNYSPENNVNFYGMSLPEATLTGGWQVAINEQPVEMEWSETGTGGKAYQLVAVYSDAETQPNFGKHLYYFVLEQGKPKVLVTQQNQGNEMNYLYFNETENQALRDGFSNIVAK
ncbi:DUF4767 domain-containing protein [Vagococcus fluvialis]|jgi:hypothetical protein|uniref:DUF4767 domain-containing protein n=1 Tax=Vagococcus fluvialis TaxID=2738 RepID=UPI001432B37E|nr:DUF4767 domain-containing protein [Vagococcus fluvialis]NKC58470.1 DUF4767 domain-containing protein [Vagococcus fluvialis]NKD49298.1 DUF4767 domain-containing protein [Vagococcus fluvialis]